MYVPSSHLNSRARSTRLTLTQDTSRDKTPRKGKSHLRNRIRLQYLSNEALSREGPCGVVLRETQTERKCFISFASRVSRDWSHLLQMSDARDENRVTSSCSLPPCCSG